MMRATLFSTTTIGILIIFLGHQIDAHSSFRGLTNNNTITTIDTHHRQLQCSVQSACTNGACCSQWGFCGFSDSHCGANCISGCPSGVTPPPSPPPTPLPVTPSPTPQPVVIGDNKIINGNFESRSISPWYANSNVGTINIDTSTYHTGYQSIFVSNRSTGTWNGIEQNILSSNNGITGVVPNERYVLSSYVKLKEDTSLTLPQTVRITIRLKDTNNNEGWIGISQLVSTTEWTLIQGELTINTNNNVNSDELQGVYLYINGPDVNVEYWVDDVSVVLANDGNSSDNPTMQPSKSPTNVPSNSPTTSSPTTLSPSNNPISPLPGSCPHSVFNKDICCNEACGTCGGSGCGSRPGGGSNCCSGTIRDSGVMCINSDPPCIISEEDPTLLPTNRPITSAPITDLPTGWPTDHPTSLSPTSSPSSRPSVSFTCVCCCSHDIVGCLI